MGKNALAISLEAIQDDDISVVGTKTLSLARMNRIGLAVPPGFCIRAAAYREHISCNDLMAHIENSLNELANTQSDSKKDILLDIRKAIIDAPMTSILQGQIESHYRTLGADPVAVRSSATAEDLPGHSFAGQYETFLGISNLQDCIKAIKKCWASLWTLRAYEYRQKNGFDHLKVNMAVIVQSLVQADASGVIFTADPVTGYSSRIIIESCSGLGEALVSGKVAPDRFIIDRKKCRIVSKNIISEPSITDSAVKKLAKLAQKTEESFGCPQDIEWAMSENKIYLLQGRPITTIPAERSWEQRQMWCSNPVREVMPDVVTPITLSMLFEVMGEKFFDPVFRLLCCDRGDHPVYSLIAGRIYFNANIWGAVFRHVPGVGISDLTELTGGHKEFQKLIERLQIVPDEDLPDIKFSSIRFLLKIPLIIVGILANTPRKGRRILAKIGAENEEWSRLDVPSLSAEQIIAYCQELLMDFRELLSHALYLFSVFVSLPVLDLICKRWLSADSSCTGRLLAGVGDMDDAVAGLDLWRLAVAADATTEVKNLILSDDWRTIEPKLSQLDSGRRFLEDWGRFMNRHGHHCRAELELYNPRWSETPDYILKLVRTYISQIGEIDPVENFSTLAEKRRRLEQQCRKKLRNPLKRMIFNRVLVRSQKGSIFRENVKSEVIRLVVVLRRMLLELGKELLDKGVLKAQDDIFFLQTEEIELVVQGKADFDIHQVIAARRAQYNKNRSIMPPDVVFGEFDAEKYVPDFVDTDVDTLNGLAVSPGVAVGKARVVLRADTDEQVLAGEILVAPFTDPGWTPYFVTAVAVVMDQGGILSHGSIVAREYGIPAVVNVGAATKVIKTGRTVEVDGNRGVVRILQ